MSLSLFIYLYLSSVSPSSPGLETARQYLEHGARVTLHYRSNSSSLSSLIASFPNHTLSLYADSRNESDVVKLYESAIEKYVFSCLREWFGFGFGFGLLRAGRRSGLGLRVRVFNVRVRVRVN